MITGFVTILACLILLACIFILYFQIEDVIKKPTISQFDGTYDAIFVFGIIALICSVWIVAYFLFK